MLLLLKHINGYIYILNILGNSVASIGEAGPYSHLQQHFAVYGQANDIDLNCIQSVILK